MLFEGLSLLIEHYKIIAKVDLLKLVEFNTPSTINVLNDTNVMVEINDYIAKSTNVL